MKVGIPCFLAVVRLGWNLIQNTIIEISWQCFKTIIFALYPKNREEVRYRNLVQRVFYQKIV